MSKEAKTEYVEFDGEYIRQEIKAKNISQKELADSLGVNVASLRTCLGRNKATKMMVMCLCNILSADYKRALAVEKEEVKEKPETGAKPAEYITHTLYDCAAKETEAITQTLCDCTQLAMDDVKQLAKDMDDLKREVRETRAQMLGALKDIHATLKEIKQHNISVEVEKRQTRISMNKSVQEARGYVEKISGILQARK